jgi:hypothetical protein
VPYANFGNPQSLNLYRYVENNPTMIGDPDGHQTEKDVNKSVHDCGLCGWSTTPPHDYIHQQGSEILGGLSPHGGYPRTGPGKPKFRVDRRLTEVI